MRFLALSSIQALLLAIGTGAIIVALYFLKHRRRRLVISSTQLWKKVLENRLDNSLFERLRRYVSILVAVTTGLLIALAIARPEIPWLTGESPRTLLVLDTSPTMQARMSDGRTRWQHAAELAQALIASGSGSAQFRIADTSGQFDSPFTDNRVELRRLIDGIQPVIALGRFPEIDSTESERDAVTFITDGVSGIPAPRGTTVLSVFEEASNAGITAFEIRSMPTSPLGYEAFLEVFNAGKRDRQVEITVSGTGQQRLSKAVRIAAGSTYQESLDLSQFEGGGIRAALQSDDDAFSPDDVAYAYLPEKRRSKVLLVTSGNKFLENALKLDRLVDLTTINPKDFDGGNAFDALVLDRFAPAEAPARPALIVGAASASWLPRASGFAGNLRFESWDEAHPVLQHVSLYDVTVSSSAKVDSSGAQVLAASASSTPLILAWENPRRIQLAFDVQNSDFPYQASFPIFLDNAVSWFGRERLALRRAPGLVEVPILQGVIRTNDGRDIPAQQASNGTVFEAANPGLYVATGDGIRQYIAVNFASREFSDINRSKETGAASSPSSAIPFFRRELWFYMLCGALLLIAAEWYTYHRRITL
jgi:hypothetical protein